MYHKVKRKLKKLYENELTNVIVKQKGSYILYNVYNITNINGLWIVKKYDQVIYQFESSSTAILWCLADKYNHMMLSDNIILKDHRIQNKRTDILLAKEYLKKEKDSIKREITISRITQDMYISRSIRREIENETYWTKYIQIKGYIK